MGCRPRPGAHIGGGEGGGGGHKWKHILGDVGGDMWGCRTMEQHTHRGSLEEPFSILYFGTNTFS